MPRQRKPLTVLVTGGPTRAYLDQVRFLSNVSSGALAFSLCKALKKKGATVLLVVGPSHQPFERLKLKKVVRVETADQMKKSVLAVCQIFKPDYGVFAAAVLDFTPANPRKGKVPSTQKTWTIRLRTQPKIVDEVARKFPSIHRIGFKLEWARKNGTSLENFAKTRMGTKKLSALCLNFLSEIRGDQHPAYLFGKDGSCFRARSKGEIANWIANYIYDNAFV